MQGNSNSDLKSHVCVSEHTHSPRYLASPVSVSVSRLTSVAHRSNVPDAEERGTCRCSDFENGSVTCKARGKQASELRIQPRSTEE